MRLLATACALALAALATAAGENGMALNVEFKIDKTDFLIQESPPCLLRLTNTGIKPLQVLHPAQGFSFPVIRVVNLKTGAETLCRRPLPHMPREQAVPLAPRQSFEFGFELLEQAVLPAPGAYELSVLYEYDGGAGKAESAPVRVNVRPNTARNLMLVSANGSPSTVLYGASVNVASSASETPAPPPPEIVRSSFSVVRGGGVDQVQVVTRAEISSIPVLSEPPQGEPVESHWVAWLAGDELHCLHFDPDHGATPARMVKLRGVDPEIVPPLYTAPVRNPDVRPNGGVLVCLSNPEGTACRLQRINLTPQDAGLGRAVDIAGPRPVWLKSHTRSTGIRLVTYIQATGQVASLWSVVWPDPTTGSTPPRKRAEWPGEFVAAGSTLMDNDAMAGAVLMWAEENGQRKLKLRCWRTVNRGELETGPDIDIPWEEEDRVERAQVRVNADGDAAVLLRKPDAGWQLFFEGKLVPVQGAFASTSLPIEVVFLDAVQPMLLCAEQDLGFKLLMPDGRPLPPARK
jgi:hypothetical protein